ncbi:MAG: hypothetical protein ABL951_06700 [Alphaproteobacteria bacterium]
MPTDISSNFVRNPLGIIALFIVMIYGIAGLVTTSTALLLDERLILVIFLFAFPFIVLLVFYLLVTRHSDKLYAPGDFKDEGNYMASRGHTRADLSKTEDPNAERIKKWLEADLANREKANAWLRSRGVNLSATAAAEGDDGALRNQMVAHFGIQENGS